MKRSGPVCVIQVRGHERCFIRLHLLARAAETLFGLESTRVAVDTEISASRGISLDI